MNSSGTAKHLQLKVALRETELAAALHANLEARPDPSEKSLPAFVQKHLSENGHASDALHPELLDPSSLIEFLSGPCVEHCGHSVVIRQRVRIHPQLMRHLEFFCHWGKYGEQDGTEEILPATFGSFWIDEEVTAEEIQKSDKEGTFIIQKVVTPFDNGEFGATFFAKISGKDERIWQGKFFVDDARFSFGATGDENRVKQSADTSVLASRSQNESLAQEIRSSLGNFEQLVAVFYHFTRQKQRELRKVAFDVTKDSPELREVLSQCYEQLRSSITESKNKRTRLKLEAVLAVLEQIGLGEIVLVAPEGPHAIAGGLAQVTVGLINALGQAGLPVTLITPLYEDAQGNKHQSGETLLQQGIFLNGKIVTLKDVGEVKIPFGPTLESYTNRFKRSPSLAIARVYLAESGPVRVFFLKHKRLANLLYPNVFSDEQLKRAIFLSRGALEIVGDPRFQINAQILVTNDWQTALVHAFLQTDSRYLENPLLNQVATIHIIHNGGRDYQGRVLANHYGEDLYPLFGLAAEHFFGLSDPYDKNYFNLTAAAILHVRNALLTVSKPYAEQLLTEQGGEGLHTLFQSKSHQLFGISNGIDLHTLRRIFWGLGEEARQTLALPALPDQPYTPRRLLNRLPLYKSATKTLVQRKHGLLENPDSILISLIGRLAEQKGIDLLIRPLRDERISVLEFILRTYEQVQILIGGPMSLGDAAAQRLRRLVDSLKQRYPGRMSSIFDFILHQDALEITGASDFFLMPSRYEPGGITQLEALATGTLVIARDVGGLRATLHNYLEPKLPGTGFLFQDFSPKALRDVMVRAIGVHQNTSVRRKLIAHAALAENDWSDRTPKYLALFQHVAGVLETSNFYAHLGGKVEILRNIRPGGVVAGIP